MPQENVIDEVFVESFRNDAKMAYQRNGALLRPMVQTQDDVVGASTTFYNFGVVDDPESPTQGGDIPILDADQNGVPCTLVDKAGGIYRRSLDLLKVSTDQKRLAASGLAMSFGRYTDTQIIGAMSGTSKTVGDYTTGFTNSIAMQAMESLYDDDVPDDGQIYCALASHAWNEFKSFSKVSSRDYAGELYPWLKGRQAFMWDNIVWLQHSGLSTASGVNCDCYMWHKVSVGHASGQMPTPDINWVPQKRAWLIGADMSQGGCLVDTRGVVKIKVNNTTPIT